MSGIDERLRMPGAGRGRDMGLQLDWDTSRPIRDDDGRPRSHDIVVGADVAGSRETETAFTGTPTRGSWAPADASVVGASGIVLAGPGVLRGYSLRETTGTAPAVFRIHGGLDAFAPVIAVVSLVAGESVRDWFGESGVRTRNGLYFELVTGTVEGSVWHQGTL